MMEKDVKNNEVKKEKKVYVEKEKSLLGKIFNIVLWVIVIAWMSICVFDFLRVHNEKDAIFCLKKTTTKYDDGEVYTCTGLGYKVYTYDRENFKALEFGPFWIKDRSEEIK